MNTLSKIIDLTTQIILVCASVVSAVFIALQYYISEQKRKDDLFKVRYDVYQEIIRFVRLFDSLFINTANTIQVLEREKQEAESISEKNSLSFRINQYPKEIGNTDI